MKTLTLQNWQFREYGLQFELDIFSDLPVFDRLVSVYRNTVLEAGRIIKLILKIMATKFRINSNQPGGNATYLAYGDFIDTTNNVKLGDSFYVNIDETQFDKPEDEKAYVYAGIVTEASSRSYGGFSTSDIQDMVPMAPAGLLNAPQASITDAPADATTNYNTITTLLGSLTGAVNTANTKQNEIATKFNSLLAELRTLGLISS